jgi:cytochrome c oxidase cbb3-type subunit 4
VNKILNYFHTDWEKLTGFDWVGLIMVIIISMLMFAVYLWVWLPSNKSKFEKYRDFALKDNLEEKKNHG